MTEFIFFNFADIKDTEKDTEKDAEIESDFVFSLDKTCDIVVSESAAATYGTPTSENPLTATLHLTYSGNHGAVTFDINWGDGNTDYGVTSTTPSHTYLGEGIYSATVTAYDDGLSDCYAVYSPSVQPVCVIAVSESAAITYGTPPSENPLTATLHLSPSGYYATRRYDINWGDTTSDSNLTTDTPSHTYGVAGTYAVAVTIKDDTTCTAGVSPNAQPSCLITVSGSTSGSLLDCTLTITPSGYFGAYSFYIEWGDSSNTTTSSTIVNHTYPGAGGYTINITISDETTCTSSGSTSFTATEA